MAARSARATLEKLLDFHRPDRAFVCLSDPSRRYFRHDLLPAYKPNQKPRPPFFDDAMSIVRAMATVKTLPGLEADDVVGILATGPWIPGPKLIASDDQDLLMIPGRHRRAGKTFDVSPEQAGCRHLLATLIGKGSDGRDGCRGVGPKTAEKVLSLATYADSPAGCWRAVVATFEQYGFTAADALLQARLARICRFEDYDLERHAVRPWIPPELAAMRLAVPA